MIRTRVLPSSSSNVYEKDCVISPIPTPSLNNSNYSTAVRHRLWRLLIVVVLCTILLYMQIFLDTQLINKNVHKKHLAESKERITVAMNTFKRYDMMDDAVEHYSSCEFVKYIYIVWSEKGDPPQRLAAKYSERKHPKVTFIRHDVDSLNNRFKPIETDRTDAIFSVDDDVRVPCRDLANALEVWQGNPRTIVGFMPRVHLRRRDELEYRCWWSVWWHGFYSIILTKAALFHHDYFRAYTFDMPESIRQLVDKGRNCEDIAMQFLISNSSRLPPVYVKGHVTDLGTLNGISTSRNIVSAKHMNRRSECLNSLVNIYGKNPLITSHIIVDSAANGWTNVPSTYMEFISSDLWKL